MTKRSEIVLDDVTAYIVGLFPNLNVFEQSLSLELYRLLAEGQPVPRQELAQRLESPIETINKTLDTWPGVFSDEKGRIAGYWGLAIPEAYTSPHRIRIGGQSLSLGARGTRSSCTSYSGKPQRLNPPIRGASRYT